ncbi:hypothetical protein AX15_003674 [Amanita polypyramis BW_CC]|nr:hypothetical protein AX15_003674 [Amanita polypyramis BW_CC]
MHALSHSLTHRGPPATRTRVRWQPYGSIPSSSMTTTLPSPASVYLSTPTAPTTLSPSLPYSHELSRPKQPTVKSVSQSIKEASARDLTKTKFALGLVDQAVKSLSEIWRSQDIPSIFVTCSKATTSTNCAYDFIQQSHQQNPQLPSPLSPSRRPSPASNSASLGVSDAEYSQPKNNLLPIKGFVHEVLRRSRTSGCVLQTALCYIEAIRPKIPGILRRQKAGEMEWKEPGLADRLVPATDADDQQTEENMSLESIAADPMLSTKAITRSDTQGNGLAVVTGQPDGNGSRMKQPDLIPPAVDVPSPLLCPRRSFLAALILASKFMQDKCYSNRAWAKLSGLSPREIGRCERALGEALEWRLWVGKMPMVSQPSTAIVQRVLCRARSESCLESSLSKQTPFLIRNNDVVPASPDRSVRRCSTLPADAFAPTQNACMSRGYDVADVPMIPVQPPTVPPALVEIKDDSPGSQSSTPSLIYSPSSTESSSGGDRTIQTSFQEPIEDLNTTPAFDDRRPCISYVESYEQLSSTAIIPLAQVASKMHAPLSGLELTSLAAVKRSGNTSGIVVTMSPEGLCRKAGQLDERLPCTWRLGESTLVS